MPTSSKYRHRRSVCRNHYDRGKLFRVDIFRGIDTLREIDIFRTIDSSKTLSSPKIPNKLPSKFLSSNGSIEPEEYLSDKQVQQQTIGLFGKEIAEEINNFIQQETGITVQD